MRLSVFFHHIEVAAKQRELSLPEMLKEVRSYGIEAVELDYATASQDIAGLKRLLDEAGIGVACVYGFFRFGEERDSAPGLAFLDTAAALGAGKVLVIPGFIESDVKPEERKASLKGMADALNDMCLHGAKLGVSVTMEDFDDVRAPFSNSDELLWILDAVPGLRLTFDTGNFIYRGEDALEAYGKLRNHVVHVHCKDRSLDEGNGGTPKLCVDGTKLYPSPVGEGCLPLADIVDRLNNSGYTGIYAIEHFDSVDQSRYMKQSADWLRQKLGM
ncbi:sugar phosphate isomerase/epimerase family protein [Paenibacillus sp. CAU 1782]